MKKYWLIILATAKQTLILSPSSGHLKEKFYRQFMTSLEQNELFTEEIINSIAAETPNFTGRTIFKMLNAMSCMRQATKDNKLTEVMVRETVKRFVGQEAQILN